MGRLVQTVLVIGGCLAICIAIFSLVISALNDQGLVETQALFSTNGSIALICAGALTLLFIRLWMNLADDS